MNLAVLQAVPPASPWNGPAWSISAESGAYFAFPLIGACIFHCRSKHSVFAATLVAMTVTIIGAILVSNFEQFDSTSPVVIWLRISGEFTAGCFIWAYWCRSRPDARISEWLFLGGAVGCLTIILLTPGQGALDLLTLPFIGLIVFSGASLRGGPVGRWLASRTMLFGGRISYSIYMWHFIVLMIVEKVMPWASYEGTDWPVRLSVAGVYLLTILLGATVLYYGVKEPKRKLIRAYGRAQYGRRPELDAYSRAAI